MKQFGVYFQDDWRLTSRMTLNVGLRYDLVTGFAIDQSSVTNFQKLQAAGQSGLFNGVVGFQEWGPSSKEDYNNIQPRIGVAWDVFGNGRDLFRAGWGIYYDFGYTNANILFPGLSAQGGSGRDLHGRPTRPGIKNPDGSFFTFGQPISNIASQNQVEPERAVLQLERGRAAGQAAVHEPVLDRLVARAHASTVIDVDYVHVEGKDLGVRWPLNTITAAGTRRYASLGFSPANPTMNMSIGASKFDGFNIGMRRRMANNWQLNGWYQWSNARGLGGLGLDELTTNLVQDATDPLDRRAVGAVGADRRAAQGHDQRRDQPAVGHLRVADLPLPVGAAAPHLDRVRRERRRRSNNDIYTTAYKFTGIDDAGNAVVQGDRARARRSTAAAARRCRSSTCACRRSSSSRTAMNIEAIGEIFNLFNAINPNFGVGAASSSAVLHGHRGEPRGQHGVHEADRVLGRLRSARAARRPDRVQVHVLTTGTRDSGSGLGFRSANQLGLGRHPGPHFLVRAARRVGLRHGRPESKCRCVRRHAAAAAACLAAPGVRTSRRGARHSPEPAPTPSAIRTVVLVTVDTLRADRVGAYGWAAARTPAMDALAARGVRFTRAFAPAPITLPSHASLLTGLYPPGHGSRHNGMRMSDGPATLATVLRDQGWATGAFVAAFPLDRRFGLDRGFDRYGDRMPRGADGRLLNERPGHEVVDEALAWARGVDGQADACSGCTCSNRMRPTSPTRRAGLTAVQRPQPSGYDDEVAKADGEIGRLLAGLGERSASALVVVAGDHGEAFGEHGEIAHSVFLYDTTLRVPLVMAGPGISALPARTRRGRLARGCVPDGARTPSDFRRGTSTASACCRSSGAARSRPASCTRRRSRRSTTSGGARFAASGPDRGSTSPRRHPSSTTWRRMRVSSATPSSWEATRARDLEARVAKYSGPEPPPAADPASTMDAESRRRLGALGYVASSPAAASGGRPDPKDRRELAARMAQVAAGELEGEALRATLETIVSEDPRNGQARMRLGYSLLERGDLRAAETHFRAALAASMPTADVHLGLALCFASTGRASEAAAALMEARRLEPGNPVVEANLGALALDAGDVTKAAEYLGEALRIDPDLHQARFNLARALARQGRRADALRGSRDAAAAPAGAGAAARRGSAAALRCADGLKPRVQNEDPRASGF